MNGRFVIRVESRFEAAHNLRHYRGACENIHGHSYKVELRVISPLDETRGYGIDFADLQGPLDELLARFDHRYLNEQQPFTRLEPTAENLARWLAEQLEPGIRQLGGAIRFIRVWEGPHAFAQYEPELPDPR